MKRPAFQFYTKDWRASLKLRRCSDAARGAWIDLICVMHESEEYGVLRWSLKEIAHTSKIKLQLLRELAEKGVLKGADHDAAAFIYTPKHAGKSLPSVTLLEPSREPMWYCSRLVRDEWIRGRRGESTWFSTDRQPSPKPSPKPVPTRTIGERPGDGPSSSASSSIGSSSQDSNIAHPHTRADESRSTSKPPRDSKAIAKTNQLLEEQRRAAERATPPPDGFMDEWKKPVDHFAMHRDPPNPGENLDNETLDS